MTPDLIVSAVRAGCTNARQVAIALDVREQALWPLLDRLAEDGLLSFAAGCCDGDHRATCELDVPKVGAR